MARVKHRQVSVSYFTLVSIPFTAFTSLCWVTNKSFVRVFPSVLFTFLKHEHLQLGSALRALSLDKQDKLLLRYQLQCHRHSPCPRLAPVWCQREPGHSQISCHVGSLLAPGDSPALPSGEESRLALPSALCHAVCLFFFLTFLFFPFIFFPTIRTSF